MSDHELLERLRRTLDAGKNAEALPAPLAVASAEYTDAERYRHELRELRRHPLPIAPVASLAEVGSRAAKELAGQRVVATRDAAGALRVLDNRCRHRGALVVDEGDCSPAKKLVCPYHGWTYDLDGAIAHVPERETGFSGIANNAMSLVRQPGHELAGMLWAGGDVPPALREELSALDLGAHRVLDRRTWSGELNWKLGVNAFLETYHFKVAHRTGIAPHFVWNRILVDAFGDHLRLTLPRSTFSPQTTAADFRRHVSFVYFVFPCSFFSVLPDHTSFITFLPDGLARTRVESHIFVPADDDRAEYWERNAALFRQTIVEDMALCESIQRGLAGDDRTFTFATFENAVAAFRATLERLLA